MTIFKVIIQIGFVFFLVLQSTLGTDQSDCERNEMVNRDLSCSQLNQDQRKALIANLQEMLSNSTLVRVDCRGQELDIYSEICPVKIEVRLSKVVTSIKYKEDFQEKLRIISTLAQNKFTLSELSSELGKHTFELNARSTELDSSCISLSTSQRWRGRKQRCSIITLLREWGKWNIKPVRRCQTESSEVLTDTDEIKEWPKRLNGKALLPKLKEWINSPHKSIRMIRMAYDGILVYLEDCNLKIKVWFHQYHPDKIEAIFETISKFRKQSVNLSVFSQELGQNNFLLKMESTESETSYYPLGLYELRNELLTLEEILYKWNLGLYTDVSTQIPLSDVIHKLKEWFDGEALCTLAKIDPHMLVLCPEDLVDIEIKIYTKQRGVQARREFMSKIAQVTDEKKLHVSEFSHLLGPNISRIVIDNLDKYCVIEINEDDQGKNLLEVLTQAIEIEKTTPPEEVEVIQEINTLEDSEYAKQQFTEWLATYNGKAISASIRTATTSEIDNGMPEMSIHIKCTEYPEKISILCALSNLIRAETELMEEYKDGKTLDQLSLRQLSDWLPIGYMEMLVLVETENKTRVVQVIDSRCNSTRFRMNRQYMLVRKSVIPEEIDVSSVSLSGLLTAFIADVIQ